MHIMHGTVSLLLLVIIRETLPSAKCHELLSSFTSLAGHETFSLNSFQLTRSPKPARLQLTSKSNSSSVWICFSVSIVSSSFESSRTAPNCFRASSALDPPPFSLMTLTGSEAHHKEVSQQQQRGGRGVQQQQGRGVQADYCPNDRRSSSCSSSCCCSASHARPLLSHTDHAQLFALRPSLKPLFKTSHDIWHAGGLTYC